MKKNLVIMLMMVLCAGFASAQTVSTVRGFVPGGSTGAMNNDTYATYATFAQPFATMVNNNGHEVTVGLAQMQLVTDSITDVVTCGQGYHKHGFDLTEEELQELLVQCENEGQRGYLRSQKPNVAVQDYYYDSLVVIDLYVCPCTTTVENEEYEVIALNGECWFKENMRNNFEGSMVYTSELNSVDPADPEQLKTFGRLYTYEATISGAEVCEDGEIQGICPEKWHLPTVDEVDPLFTLPAENLRVDGHWIVDGNNNMTEFSAQPAGYYNSISQRFEGMLTETDFWMVDCDSLNPEDNQLPVLQLIYSCNTPLKPNRPKEDAISVRCVYNIVKHLEDCDPNPNPNPDPQYTCPSVSFQPSDAMSVLPGNIASYGEIQSTITSVVFDGVAWGNFGARDSVKNQLINDITPDGDFVWQYTNGNLTTEVMSLTGNILITFDNGQVCSTPVSREQEVVNDCPTIGNVTQLGDLGYSFAVNDYDANKISNVTVHYTATYGVLTNADQTVDIEGDDSNLEYDNDDNAYRWLYNEEAAVGNNPQIIQGLTLIAINTTAKINYDGQICTGFDYKDISVELEPVQPSEPGFIPTCFVNEIIASQTQDAFGVSGNLSGYSTADPTYNINSYVQIMVKGVAAAEETVLQSDAQVAGDGSFSWSSNEYNLEYLHTTYPGGLTITISYTEGDSCPDPKSTTVTLW